jgi:hypothetical protein
MPDEVAKIAEPGDMIFVRHCSIEASDGEVSPLTLRFTRPVKQGDEFRGTLHIDCKHFSRIEKMFGQDEVEVIGRLFWIGRISLENLEGGGYSIWHQFKGDLHWFDFWTGSEFPQAFCLPSAFTAARREEFYRENDGRFLLPSHRIGIEPDRPAVTIYRTHKDGSDSLGSVIGSEELKTHTWESLEREVGKRTLWDSPQGVAFMIALQPERRAED